MRLPAFSGRLLLAIAVATVGCVRVNPGPRMDVMAWLRDQPQVYLVHHDPRGQPGGEHWLSLAPDVKARVAGRLLERGITGATLLPGPILDDSREALRLQFGRAVVVMIFKDEAWRSVRLPGRAGQVRVPSTISLRIRHLVEERIVREASCQVPRPKTDRTSPGPTDDAERARLLERFVGEVVERCSAELLGKVVT